MNTFGTDKQNAIVPINQCIQKNKQRKRVSGFGLHKANRG